MAAPLMGRRRKRRERPMRPCMACQQSTGTVWKWLCDGCFGQLPFARRKAIAEAGRDPQRIFGLCREAADWVQQQREKRVEA